MYILGPNYVPIKVGAASHRLHLERCPAKLDKWNSYTLYLAVYPKVCFTLCILLNIFSSE